MSRQSLGGQSPLNWSLAQVWKEVCTFLLMDETFDHDSPPRDDSLVLRTAIRLSTNTGWDFDESLVESVLPCWVESRWGESRFLASPNPDAPLSPNDTQPVSKASTQSWVKYQEFWIHRKVENQLDNEQWDGIIDAGTLGVSVLDRYVPIDLSSSADHKMTEAQREPIEGNHFIRHFNTWDIQFAGERCTSRTMLGFEYLAVLLEHPGTAFKALEMQTLVGGLVPIDREFSDENTRDIAKNDFAEGEMVDDRARREAKERLRQIEGEIAYRRETNELKKIETLEMEALEIRSYLGKARSRGFRDRVFAGEKEKARVSITKNLRRAYLDICEQAPKTAKYFESQIQSGSEFMYRDCSTLWKVQRRTPQSQSR